MAFVIVFVSDGDRFVVSHIRSRGWCVPSGWVDAGEAPEQAAERELMEEAGCTAMDLRPLGSVEWERPSGLQVGLAFVGRLQSLAKPTAPSEVHDVRLMKLEDLRESYFDWSPYYEAMFQRALEALR